jgi:hypothetical protein
VRKRRVDSESPTLSDRPSVAEPGDSCCAGFAATGNLAEHVVCLRHSAYSATVGVCAAILTELRGVALRKSQPRL